MFDTPNTFYRANISFLWHGLGAHTSCGKRAAAFWMVLVQSPWLQPIRSAPPVTFLGQKQPQRKERKRAEDKGHTHQNDQRSAALIILRYACWDKKFRPQRAPIPDPLSALPGYRLSTSAGFPQKAYTYIHPKVPTSLPLQLLCRPPPPDPSKFFNPVGCPYSNGVPSLGAAPGGPGLFSPSAPEKLRGVRDGPKGFG